MTQIDKEILLKDLCARLPYGVKMNHIADDEHSPKTLIGVAKDMITLEGLGGYECVDVEDYKPYLFPLLSMTDEQRKYIDDRWGINEYFDFEVDPYWGKHFVELGDVIDYVNWLIENHFDFRGLIEKGIAIDATGLNIY
jgi:hypothetical protein